MGPRCMLVLVGIGVSVSIGGMGPTGALAQTAETSYRLELDIPYRAGEARAPALTPAETERCSLDWYYPTDPKLKANGFATVVWFHGGGLTGGKKAIPRALRDQGLAVAAANYRLSPNVKAPVYIEDAAAAVAWVFQHVENYGGAKTKIYVAGVSAGGYLTSMIGLDPRWLKPHGLHPNQIAGLIPYTGQAITHFTIRAERGLPDTVPVIDDLAPLFHVRKDAPPILLITGDRNLELRGRYEENAYLWRMLREVGHDNATLYELEGFNHGQMAEPAHYLLLRFVKQWPAPTPNPQPQPQPQPQP